MNEYQERIKRMRARYVRKAEVDIERGIYMTQAYQETEGREPAYRQAKALELNLRKKSIGIFDDELLVGRMTMKYRGGNIIPEISSQFLADQMDELSTRPQDTFEPISAEDQAKVKEFLPYWKDRDLIAMWSAKVPKDKLHYLETGSAGGVVYALNGHYLKHSCANYVKLLKVGLSGIRKEVEEELSKIHMEDPDDFEKMQYLQACLISLDAVMEYSMRYSILAAEMAESCQDPQRKKELLKISEICAQVPAKPARSFHEALQSMLMVWICMNIEGCGYGMSLGGRIDQWLYPYYRHDIDEGIMTRDEAKMLLSMFYLKANEIVIITDRITSGFFTGLPQTVNINLGGVDENGHDAVNELSYLCLDADLDVGLPSNDLVVRISKKTPEAFVMKAIEVAKALRGKLKFMSDEMCIQQLLHDGFELEDARNYVITGCNNPTIPGKSTDLPGGNINMPLLLELALNNGHQRMTGELIGVETGDPRQFTSYEQVVDAYKKQVEYFFPIAIMFRNSDRYMFAKYRPVPFESVLFDGTIQSGKDMADGGLKYSRIAISMSGTPDVGDGLAAIKKVVFEDKKITMAQLIDALDSNFEGAEDIRKLLLAAPKFGNDDDYVDDIVNDVLMHGSKILTSMKGACGAKINCAAAAVTANVIFGYNVGATPDGRKAGEPISEGGISPHQGRNVSGPIATYRSVSKIDHTRLTNGSVLNMRFSPNALKDTTSMRKFSSMLRTFLETGGFFVQFNIVDTETLRAAQREPEKYRDLLVRVATYSAYFVELGENLQNDIINRMEMEI